MSSILDDLATLPVNAEFDVPIAEGSYQDPLPIAPLPEGNYRLKVVKFSLDKNQDGTLRLARGQWPTVNLERIEVVEGEHTGKVAATFQRVYSVPFARGGSVPNASGLGDLIRAFDQTVSVSNVKDAIELLHQFVESGASFRGRIVWTAYDKDHADQQFAEIGGKQMASKEQYKAISKSATVKGVKNFPQGPNGPLPIVTGRSGAQLEARAELSNLYPSGQDVKLAN
jgi:hypothetical protein